MASVSKLFGKTIKIANTSGMKIGGLGRDRKPPTKIPNSALYCTPCNGCDKAYYSETGCGFSTRISEQRADVLHHRTSNAMVVHVDEAGHPPDWKRAIVIHEGLHKLQRKLMEVAYGEDHEHRAGQLQIIKGRGNVYHADNKLQVMGIS